MSGVTDDVRVEERVGRTNHLPKEARRIEVLASLVEMIAFKLKEDLCLWRTL